MFKAWLFFCLSVCLVFSPLRAQQGSDPPVNGLLYLNLETGLPSRNISAVIQAHKGMMWFATDNGLCSYNGVDVDVYNHHPNSPIRLPSSVISDLEEDEEGRFWICTAKGLCIMNIDRKQLIPTQKLGIPNFIAQQGHSFIEKHPQGGFWFLAGTTLFHIKFVNKQLFFQKLGQSPFSIYTSKKMLASPRGQLWIMSGDEIAIWEKDHFRVINYPVKGTGLPFGHYLGDYYVEPTRGFGDSITLVGNAKELLIFSLDQENKIWRAQAMSSKLDPSVPAFEWLKDFEKKAKKNVDHVTLKSILLDKHKNYWFLTNLGIYGIGNGQHRIFQQLKFTKGKSIRKIFQNNQGDIWINTYAGLMLYRQNPERVSQYPKAPKGAWSILQVDSHDYLVGYESREGLAWYRMQADGLHLIRTFFFDAIFDLVKTGDTAWMVNNKANLLGFDLKDKKLVQTTQFFDTSSQVLHGVLKALVLDQNQNLWLGGAGGIFFLQRQPNGLYKRKDATVPLTLRSVAINSLYLDQKQNLWIGSIAEGLIRYHLPSKQIRRYQIQEGLVPQVIFSIQGSTKDSLIWIGTQNGLSCMKVKTEEFFTFYENSGLPGNELNTRANLLAKDGTLYMGGTNGVAYLSRQQIRLLNNIHTARPYVKLNIANTSLLHHPKPFYPAHQAQVHLTTEVVDIELRFLSNDLLNSSLAQYRYKISGLSRDWLYAKSTEKILLHHLKPGRYKLSLSVQYKGNWSAPYQMTLIMPRYWYQTWWFYTLAGVLFLLGIYVLYRIRIAQLKKEYQLRKQISEDLHDDLGSRIYALKSLAFQITQAGARHHKLDELLTYFEALSHETLLTIRNFIWAFDPKNDQLQDMMDRMEKFVLTAIRPVVRNTQFVTVSNSTSLKMLPGTKYHGLRVFQELLTNMVKHTSSQNIVIDFQIDERFLLITVQNQYAELSKNQSQEEHYGQENIAHRIHEVGGQLSWQDEHNCQTAIIRLPFA